MPQYNNAEYNKLWLDGFESHAEKLTEIERLCGTDMYTLRGTFALNAIKYLVAHTKYLVQENEELQSEVTRLLAGNSRPRPKPAFRGAVLAPKEPEDEVMSE